MKNTRGQAEHIRAFCVISSAFSSVRERRHFKAAPMGGGAAGRKIRQKNAGNLLCSVSIDIDRDGSYKSSQERIGFVEKEGGRK